MTHAEAVQLAAKLKGLFPSMTDQQIRYAVEFLEPADANLGAAAVERYIREFTEFRVANLEALLAQEGAKKAPRKAGGVPMTPEQRKQLADRLRAEREHRDEAFAAVAREIRQSLARRAG